MPDQTARDPRFPVACARCGGRISEPVAFCPHCGAHARFALSEAVATAPASPEPTSPAIGARVEPSMRAFGVSDFEGDLDEPWPGPPTPLFAGPQGAPYGDARASAFRGARQWSVKGGMGLVLGAFVVLYGGVVLLHRYDQAAPSSPVARADSASRSVEGAIGLNSSKGNAQPPQKLDDSVPPDMSIANLPPPVTSTAPPTQAPAPAATQAPAPAPAPAAMQAAIPAPTQTPTPTFTLGPAPSPSVTTGTVSPPSMADAGARQTSPNASGDARGTSHGRTRGHGKSGDWRSRDGDKAPAQAPAQATPQPQAQPQPRETRASVATRTLDSVQARLVKNDLSGARASLSGVLATDPRNGYALSLRDQLASREQARDASLNAARACVVQSRWHCVWHNAGTALSIDASSTEAKALVDRAIIESGAATAPAGPGPDNVQVPMVQ